jgi:hypothetical protein
VQRSSAVAKLDDDLAILLNLADRPVASADELANSLRQIYDVVFNVDLSRYDAAAVRGQAPGLMKAIFLARIRLRDRIADWHQRGLMTPTAVRWLRDVFRVSRYGGDMLGEIRIGNTRLGPHEKTLRAFTGTDFNTFVNPVFDAGKNLPFRSGDLLLVRGRHHNSAAIARIGDVDSQFSHIAMIYVDPAGEHWALEALIEDGAVVTKLADLLAHDLGRAVLYRHKDAALAMRAAEIIHERVLATTTGKARHIPYDFSMRLRGRRRWFCSKLIYLAFKDASGGKIKLPAFRTKFDMKNRDFLRRIGVKAKETFAPHDIDIDPSFDVVAEWQDYRVTSDLRAQDMIMTKFFAWMDAYGYKFKEDFLVKLIAVFGRLSSYFSSRIKNMISSVVPKVPSNMSRSCVAAIVMLHKTAEQVLASLRELEESTIKMTGRPLHPREMLAQLERLRDVSGGRIGYLVGRS